MELHQETPWWWHFLDARLIKWVEDNDLVTKWRGCIVATYPSAGGRSEIKSVSSHEENTWESPPTFIWAKTLEKPKRGMWILKKRVRELFTCGEGISTPCVRHKGRQPLIECAKTWLQYYLFSLFHVSLFFWGVDKGVALTLTYPQVRWGIQTYIVL